MIISVVAEFHWLPSYVGGLFLDQQDQYGLEYWYNVVVKNDNEVQKILNQ